MSTRFALVLTSLVAGMAAFSPFALAAPAKPIGIVSLYPNQTNEVLAFQWEENLDIEGSSSGGGTAKVAFSTFKIFKALDALSPQIFLDAASGKRFPRIHIDLLTPGPKGTVSISYQLEDVAMVGDGLTTLTDSQTPVEVVSLRVFARIIVVSTDASGTTTACWDVALNRSCSRSE
jgi:type VI protein secretion system component Hcp